MSYMCIWMYQFKLYNMSLKGKMIPHLQPVPWVLHLAVSKINLLDLFAFSRSLVKTSFQFSVWWRYYVKWKLNSNAQSIWNERDAFIPSQIILEGSTGDPPPLPGLEFDFEPAEQCPSLCWELLRSICEMRWWHGDNARWDLCHQQNKQTNK